MLVDTHCHIHEPSYALSIDEVMARADEACVTVKICVGTDITSSRQAGKLAAKHDATYYSIGVHPHETADMHKAGGIPALQEIADSGPQGKLVAVGEIGLDYFYTHSPKEVQIERLHDQLQLAQRLKVPVIFHVREAFDDFWPIFDTYPGLHGVLHSFTDSELNMNKALERGLYIGVNGISTFTKDAAQQQMFAAIPLEHLLLETDAPFLTPVPFRGKVNEPAFVKNVAEHHAKIRGLSIDDIAAATTANAHALFALH